MPLNSVETGKIYVIALMGDGNDFYVSNENGIYSYSELENIKAILKESE